jgi:hypothetical protein
MHFLFDKAITVLVYYFYRKVRPDPCRGFFFFELRQLCCRFCFVVAGLATRFGSDPLVSYIS